MKKALLFVVLIFSVSASAFALQHKNTSSVYEHMLEINKNWQKGHAQNYNQLISFESDIDRIQMHLLFVEQALLAKSTKHLSEKQKLNRVDMLGVLHSYALNKLFPINTGHSVRQPYFIDNFGTHCAVGFLVKKSGFEDISKAIAEKQNFAYVREIVSPDLVQWSMVFGFTLEELAWIQPGYAPSQSYSQIGQGANGKVTHSEMYGPQWFFSGEFDSLDNLPCLKIGKYENGQLSCLASGLDGEVNDLDYHQTKGIKATGHFLHNGIYYPLATLINNTWTFDSIPNRPNARATASALAYTYGAYVAIDHPTIAGDQEVWKAIYGNWSLVATVHGKVFEIDEGGSFFGAFESAEVYENNTWVNYNSKNVFIMANTGYYQTISGIVPDTIFAFTKINNVIYVGGRTSTHIGSSGALVSSILNGIAQPLLTISDLDPTAKYAVYDMKTNDDNSIYISGNFESHWSPYWIKNVGLFHPSSAYIETLGYFDNTVYTIGSSGQTLFTAGDFSSNLAGGSFTWDTQSVNRLAKLDGIASINENDIFSEKIQISPNPSKGNLFITGTNIDKVEILDPMGKIIHIGNKTEMDFHHLPAGMYLVRVTDQTGNAGTKRWIKE